MNTMSVDQYLDSEQHNLSQMRKLRHFRELVPLSHSIYLHTFGLIPKDSPPYYGRLLLVCHKSFLGAVSLILRLHPDDAASVTRRACEAAVLAAAIKHDKKNLREWQSFEKRTERWDTRQEGKKPKHFSPKLTYPPDDANVEHLRSQVGLLSDAYVHFTPEFLLHQDWRLEDGPGDKASTVNLNYFTNNRPQIERELIGLVGTHAMALDVFDGCYDKGFRKDPQWMRLTKLLQIRGTRLVKLSPSLNVDERKPGKAPQR